MLKLVKYLEKCKRQAVAAPLFKLLESVMELFLPLIMADILTVGTSDTRFSVTRALLMLLIICVGYCFAFYCQKNAARAGSVFATELRSDLVRKISEFSYADKDKFDPSYLISLVTVDTANCQLAVSMFIRLAPRTPFITIGSLVMSFIISPKLALIFVIATALVSLMLFLVIRLIMPFVRRTQSRLDGISTSTQDNLSGVKVVRAFSREQSEEKRFAKLTDDYRRDAAKLNALSSLINPFSSFLLNLGIAALVFVGARFVDFGDVEPAKITALTTYMMQIVLALNILATLVNYFTRAGNSAKRILRVLDNVPSVSDDKNAVAFPDSFDMAIEFENACFSYVGTNGNQLCDVSFTLKRGEQLGIIGVTGSGKSTLVNLLPRFYDCNAGEVRVFGENVKNIRVKELRKNVAIAAQKTFAFNTTIRDNVLFGRDFDAEALNRAIECACLSELVKKKGLDFSVSEDGTNLSGGERQRLTIARALYGNPKLLILDDSLSALDFKTDLKLRQNLRKYYPDTSTVVVSQRVSSIRECDEILVLEKGRLTAKGTHEELLSSSKVYRDIYTTQAGGKVDA